MTEQNTQRAAYEAPTITDFGSIEDITKGALAVSFDDFPVGARLITPAPSGAIRPLPIDQLR